MAAPTATRLMFGLTWTSLLVLEGLVAVLPALAGHFCSFPSRCIGAGLEVIGARAKKLAA